MLPDLADLEALQLVALAQHRLLPGMTPLHIWTDALQGSGSRREVHLRHASLAHDVLPMHLVDAIALLDQSLPRLQDAC